MIIGFVRTVFIFLYKIYKEIHSEIRLTVAIDSLIGCIIGYFFLNSLVLGGVMAGFRGVVNYYLIALRILKLKPIEIKK